MRLETCCVSAPDGILNKHANLTTHVHTPAGGILDTSDCTQAQPARQIARLGDVCVSPYALNWNCKLADYSSQVRPKHFPAQLHALVMSMASPAHCSALQSPAVAPFGNYRVLSRHKRRIISSAVASVP